LMYVLRHTILAILLKIRLIVCILMAEIMKFEVIIRQALNTRKKWFSCNVPEDYYLPLKGMFT
jgi:hypothetical protein